MQAGEERRGWSVGHRTRELRPYLPMPVTAEQPSARLGKQSFGELGQRREVSQHTRGRWEGKSPNWEQQTGAGGGLLIRSAGSGSNHCHPHPRRFTLRKAPPSLANLAHEDWHLKPASQIRYSRCVRWSRLFPAGLAAASLLAVPPPVPVAKPSPCATSVPPALPLPAAGLLNCPPTCCRTGPFGTLRHSTDIHNAPLAPPTAPGALPLAPPPPATVSAAARARRLSRPRPLPQPGRVREDFAGAGAVKQIRFSASQRKNVL